MIITLQFNKTDAKKLRKEAKELGMSVIQLLYYKIDRPDQPVLNYVQEKKEEDDEPETEAYVPEDDDFAMGTPAKSDDTLTASEDEE